MVTALVPRSSGPGSSPDHGLSLLFMSKNRYLHGASLHPGVQMSTGKLNSGGNPAMDYRPIQGGRSSHFMLLKLEINA